MNEVAVLLYTTIKLGGVRATCYAADSLSIWQEKRRTSFRLDGAVSEQAHDLLQDTLGVTALLLHPGAQPEAANLHRADGVSAKLSETPHMRQDANCWYAISQQTSSRCLSRLNVGQRSFRDCNHRRVTARS